MKTRIIAVAALAAASLAAPPAFGQSAGRVTVSASCTRDAQPDHASFSISVRNFHAAAAQAMQENGAVMQKVISALKSADSGLAPKHLRTSNVSLYHDSGDPKRAAGYRASNSLNVSVERVDNLGKLITAAIEAGGTDLSGPSFGFSEGRSTWLKAAARTCAKQTALVMAQQHVKESGGSVDSIWAEETTEGGAHAPMRRSEGHTRAAMAAPVPIEVGESGVTVSVTTTFTYSK